MKIFKGKDERTYDKARSRLRRVSDTQVLDWANTAVWSIQAQLEHYPRHQAPAALRVAREGAITLLAACDELLDSQALDQAD